MGKRNDRAAPLQGPQDLAALLGLPPSKMDRLLSLPEAAEVLGLSMATLRRRIAAGELVVVRDGRCVHVAPRDLARYIAARRGC